MFVKSPKTCHKASPNSLKCVSNSLSNALLLSEIFREGRTREGKGESGGRDKEKGGEKGKRRGDGRGEKERMRRRDGE